MRKLKIVGHEISEIVHSIGLWWLFIFCCDALGWRWFDRGLWWTVYGKPSWASRGDPLLWWVIAFWLPSLIVWALMRSAYCERVPELICARCRAVPVAQEGWVCGSCLQKLEKGEQ